MDVKVLNDLGLDKWLFLINDQHGHSVSETNMF